jgi:hypothetical protein
MKKYCTAHSRQPLTCCFFGILNFLEDNLKIWFFFSGQKVMRELEEQDKQIFMKYWNNVIRCE